jgi:hypothetical protein
MAMLAAAVFLPLMAQSAGSKAWRRHHSQQPHGDPAPVPPRPAAANKTCSFGGAWTDGSSLKPVCEAMAWGCHSAGAQFWLTDHSSGFRGVAHGPADFVHSGNGPFQAGWSHSNATYTDHAACVNRGPPSCTNVGTRDCSPPPKPGAPTVWKLLHNTRAINSPPITDWTGVKSIAECEDKCQSVKGCEVWTWVWESPEWVGQGGCWAYPRTAEATFTAAANWSSGVARSTVNEAGCNKLGCCWHQGAELQCVQKEVKPCEICVTLDADAPGRYASTSCCLDWPSCPGVEYPPGDPRRTQTPNNSDWSEHTCASCGSVAADCNSIEWKSGPLSRNATTKTWMREQQIHTVHVVFSTHFDVGCGWNVHTVLDMYFHRYIPQILNVQEGLRDMGYTERLPYLMQPWITSLYVDCPPNLVFDASPNTTLICPTEAEVARYEDAIRRGDILFQAVPFNLQAEAMSPGLFEGSIELVRTLCRRYNMSDDACGSVMSGRDVPGLTRGILPLLKKHGVGGISVGTNGCVEPSFPWADGAIKSMQPFVWRDEASATEIISIWEQGYGPGEFRGRGAVQVLPSGHALAFQFMSDNSGSVSSVTEALAYYRSLQMSFPGAKVQPSSLDAFYAEARKVKAQLPTVSGEIGDVWIQGIGSDPHKMAEYNALSRARQACVDAKDEFCRMDNFAFLNFTRMLLKYPEHTWGSAGYVEGGIDVSKWSNAAFHQARDRPETAAEKIQQTQTAATYAEQRRFNMFALEALDEFPDSFLAKEARKNLAELHVKLPSVAGLTAVKPEKFTQKLVCRGVSLALDNNGALSSLSVNGKEYAGTGSELAQLQYQTYNQSDFVWYHSSTANGCGQTTCPCRECEHGFGKYNSSCPIPGFNDNTSHGCANPVRKRSLPTLRALHVSEDQCHMVAELAFAPALSSLYGSPQAAYLSLDVATDASVINVSLLLWNKTSTRLPEATWLNFKPRKGENLDANKFEINKLGSWVDPEDVVTNGNQYQHGVHEEGFRYGDLQVRSMDALLIAPITTQPTVQEICPGTPQSQAQSLLSEQGFARGPPTGPGCKDIGCSWGGTPTALPGGGTRGTGLAPLQNLTGLAWNLHNNLWSVNYPVFSPYNNDLWDNAYDDTNFQFRFQLLFT